MKLFRDRLLAKLQVTCKRTGLRLARCGSMALLTALITDEAVLSLAATAVSGGNVDAITPSGSFAMTTPVGTKQRAIEMRIA